jgi:hypothetical protein
MDIESNGNFPNHCIALQDERLYYAVQCLVIGLGILDALPQLYLKQVYHELAVVTYADIA